MIVVQKKVKLKKTYAYDGGRIISVMWTRAYGMTRDSNLFEMLMELLTTMLNALMILRKTRTRS